jgi:hypothetical protein
MVSRQPEETDAWRILLFGRKGTELLLLRGASGFRLPELRIPRWQRIAPNLNAEAKRLWQLDTVSVFPFDAVPAALAPDRRKYHIMELCEPEDLARIAPDFLLVSALGEALFADRRDFISVQQAMGFDGASFAEEYRGPFSEFGSFQKIRAWVEAQLHPLGLRSDGCFRQLQASAAFALIRFQTDRCGVWFKAVGEPSTREFRITTELTARFPSYLPVPIATCTEWNAWLSKEADGQDLFNCMEITAWRRAAESLADLQIASIAHTSDILAAGARDVRAGRLLMLANPFFEVMEQVMQQQTKATPPPLHTHEINQVQEQVVSLLEEMDFIRMPDTLNHLDPNPGNVFVSERRCTFLDWADAAVGNPFFTFEYLRQHFRRTFRAGAAAEAEICRSYLSRWSSILPRKTGEQMMRLAPLAALFAYAASVLPWNETNPRNRLELQAFLRSLGRRMHHESECLRKTAAESRAGGECHGDDVASVLGASES